MQKIPALKFHEILWSIHNIEYIAGNNYGDVLVMYLHIQLIGIGNFLSLQPGNTILSYREEYVYFIIYKQLPLNILFMDNYFSCC